MISNNANFTSVPVDLNNEQTYVRHRNTRTDDHFSFSYDEKTYNYNNIFNKGTSEHACIYYNVYGTFEMTYGRKQ